MKSRRFILRIGILLILILSLGLSQAFALAWYDEVPVKYTLKLGDERIGLDALVTAQVPDAISRGEAFGRYGWITPTQTGSVPPTDDVLPLYEAYLSQLDHMPDGARQIEHSALGYTVYYTSKTGCINQHLALTPVWSFYDQGDDTPLVMFDAIDGSVVEW